jgi:hypothetical protein
MNLGKEHYEEWQLDLLEFFHIRKPTEEKHLHSKYVGYPKCILCVLDELFFPEQYL